MSRPGGVDKVRHLAMLSSNPFSLPLQLVRGWSFLPVTDTSVSVLRCPSLRRDVLRVRVRRFLLEAAGS